MRAIFAAFAALAITATVDAAPYVSEARDTVSAKAPSRKKVATSKRSIKPASAEDGADIVVTLGPKAPFAKLIVSMSTDGAFCGRLGCAISLMGVTRAGVERDISQDDIIPNGTLGSKSEVVGALDSNGIPRIVLHQGNIDSPDTHNLFIYDKNLGRYKFIEAVSDAKNWKRLLGK